MDEKFKYFRRLEKCIDTSKYDNSNKQKKHRQYQVKYAFIMFKHCLSNEVTLGIFKKESLSSKIIRSIFRVQLKKG